MQTASLEAKNLREQEYFTLLSSLGNLADKEFVPGLTLYKHQRQAIKACLFKQYFVVGDAPGLGKTYVALISALAQHRTHNYKTVVVTIPGAINDWYRSAKIIGIDITVVSWGKVAGWGIGPIEGDFSLIVDEAHLMVNMDALRTKAMFRVLDTKQCKNVYFLSATPYTNGRPNDAYTLLLACKHPLVWADTKKEINKKKYAYQARFYERERVKIGWDTWKQEPKMAWKLVRAKNMEEFYRQTRFVPGDKNNNPNACIISRKKDDVGIDMPPVQRFMKEAYVSEAAQHTLRRDYVRLWEEYEQGVKDKKAIKKTELLANGTSEEKIGSFLAEYERLVRRAEAMVEYQIYRESAAFAKIESTLELVDEILRAHEKIVIFTSFLGVADTLGALLEKAHGKESVGYIRGDMSKRERTSVSDDFQSPTGNAQVIVSTSAGGTAITLTAAGYMIILDRPWSPYVVTQWEGRIHRVDTLTMARSKVVYYWMQIPQDILSVDVKVDKIIQEKQKNIDMMQYGQDTDGLEFDTEELEAVLSASYKELKAR